jgi:hypothetical protein
MTGPITASAIIVFPFLIAFMNILNIHVQSPSARETAGAAVTDTNSDRFAKKRSNYAEASFSYLAKQQVPVQCFC